MSADRYLNLKLEVKCVATGVVSTSVHQKWFWNQFWWEEGNASCDCNRELFFLRGLGRDDTVDPQCGEERFLVRCSDNDTGEVLYDEFEGERE